MAPTSAIITVVKQAAAANDWPGIWVTAVLLFFGSEDYALTGLTRGERMGSRISTVYGHM